MMLRRAAAALLALALPLRSPSAEEPAAKSTGTPAVAPGTPASAGTQASPGSSAPLVPTVIESDSAEMVSTEKETTFHFSNHVLVTGTNLKITCDHLVVVARRSGDAKATIGKQDNFKSLIATGNVRILQNDREATCDRAEVLPDDDKVILTGNPVVRSADGQVQANIPRVELHRGERRAIMLSEGGQRPRITLPPVKDLGYEKEAEKKKRAPKAGSGPTSPRETTSPKETNAPRETTPPPATTTPSESTLPPITVPIPASPK